MDPDTTLPGPLIELVLPTVDPGAKRARSQFKLLAALAVLALLYLVFVL